MYSNMPGHKFTRVVWLIPVKDTKSDTVVKALETTYLNISY